jgi:hypothetical protein
MSELSKTPRVLLRPNIPVRGKDYIYFARCGQHIKIGFTRNWKERRRVLSTACPTPITQFIVIAGDRILEGDLHQRFAHLRANGEWFEARDELSAYLRTIRLEDRLETVAWRP